MPDDKATAPPTIALIGYGAIAEMHANALAAAGITPVLVAGPDREQCASFAQRFGIAEATSDVTAAIASSDVEAVVLATPSGLHAQQAAAALDAGRHVLVEIPLALSHADGAALVRQAAEAELVLMVCHTLRYWSPLDRVHAWLRDGDHDVRHVTARALSLRHENVGWTGRRRSWTDDVLWHHGGHVIDQVLKLLARPVSDIGAASGPVWSVSERPMDYAITLRTDDGAIGGISLSYNSRVAASDYTVITDRDTLTVVDADVRTSSGELVSGEDAAAVQEAAVNAQDRDFLEAVRTGSSPIASAADILPVLAIQQAVADGMR